MPVRIPPIQCLLTFEALARLRSATQTADELCVTPSAVNDSRRVRASLGRVPVVNILRRGMTAGLPSGYPRIGLYAVGAREAAPLRSRCRGWPTVTRVTSVAIETVVTIVNISQQRQPHEITTASRVSSKVRVGHPATRSRRTG